MVVGLLEGDNIPLVALQEVEEPAPLVIVLEAVDVEAEQAQGGLSEASHGGESRRPLPVHLLLWRPMGPPHLPAGWLTRAERRTAGSPLRDACAAC
ncbi:g7991 [Coccomyxa elongata]